MIVTRTGKERAGNCWHEIESKKEREIQLNKREIEFYYTVIDASESSVKRMRVAKEIMTKHLRYIKTYESPDPSIMEKTH